MAEGIDPKALEQARINERIKIGEVSIGIAAGLLIVALIFANPLSPLALVLPGSYTFMAAFAGGASVVGMLSVWLTISAEMAQRKLNKK